MQRLQTAHCEAVESAFYISRSLTYEDVDVPVEDDVDMPDGMAKEQYCIKDGISQRGKQQLSDGLGYIYTVKRKTANSTTWRCATRNRTVNCKVTVMQKGDSFHKSGAHIHPSRPGVERSLTLKAKVSLTGSECTIVILAYELYIKLRVEVRRFILMPSCSISVRSHFNCSGESPGRQ